MKKGFTLIELLVVISIIGLLASVVLASLQSARNKAADANIKSNLSGIRAQAALYYEDNGQSYGVNYIPGECVTGAAVGTFFYDDEVVQNAITQAQAVGGDGFDAYGIPGDAACALQGAEWVIAIPMKGVGGGAWCVDSTGNSIAIDIEDMYTLYSNQNFYSCNL